MVIYIKKLYEFFFKIKNTFLILKIKHHVNKILINQNFNYSQKNVIKRSNGFKVISFINNKNYIKTIDYIKKNFNTKQIESEKSSNSKKFLIIKNLNLFQIPVILKLANDNFLIDVISNYLKTMPILYRAQIWFSKSSSSEISSQKFHFDREDYIQMKVFFPISSVSLDSGPLVLINADQTKQFVFNNLKRLKLVTLKDRFEDKLVFDNIPQFKKNYMTSRKGDVIFADTTNCLHYGSRHVKKPKFQLLLHYVTPFSPKIRKQIKSINKIDPMCYHRLIKVS